MRSINNLRNIITNINTKPDNQQKNSRKLFIVLNPVAGTSLSATIESKIIKLCMESKCEYEIYKTSEDDNLEQVAGDAVNRGFEIIAVAGGDGTISSVASGLVGTGIPLVILPTGTGNALANELEIPHNLEQAFGLMVNEHDHILIDAMKIDNRHFLLNVGIGISSMVVKNTKRREKRIYGKFAYVWRALNLLIGAQPYQFSLVVDGENMNYKASEIFVAGGGIIGIKLPQVDPQIVILPDDGVLDIFIIRARTVLGYLGLAFQILIGKPRGTQFLKYVQARQSISVSSNRQLPVESDGEFIGHTPVNIDLVRNAVKVIIPSQKKEE